MHTAERFWSGRTPAGWNIKIAIKRRYRCRERCFDTVSGIRQALLPARANKRKTRPRVVPPPGIIGARCLCVFFFLPSLSNVAPRETRAELQAATSEGKNTAVCDFPARLEIPWLSTKKKGGARLLYPLICSFETNRYFFTTKWINDVIIWSVRLNFRRLRFKFINRSRARGMYYSCIFTLSKSYIHVYTFRLNFSLYHPE